MLKMIGEAGDNPFPLEDVKKALRVDHDDDDDLIQTYIDAATEYVSHRSGLRLTQQGYLIERCDWWFGCLEILAGPVRDISSVKYLDADGDLQTVAESDYRWWRTSEGAELELLAEFSRPFVLDDARDAVQIEFIAGFDVPGATGSGDVPELMLPARAGQIVKLIVSFWYDNRDAVAEEGKRPIPMGAEEMILQLKVYR